MARIDATARVADGARLGDGVEIGPYCIVGPDATLGAGVRLHGHVHIAGVTTIGAETQVYPFASLGTPPQSVHYKGEPTRLVIGTKCVIREGVTMNTGTAADRGETTVDLRDDEPRVVGVGNGDHSVGPLAPLLRDQQVAGSVLSHEQVRTTGRPPGHPLHDPFLAAWDRRNGRELLEPADLRAAVSHVPGASQIAAGPATTTSRPKRPRPSALERGVGEELRSGGNCGGRLLDGLDPESFSNSLVTTGLQLVGQFRTS